MKIEIAAYSESWPIIFKSVQNQLNNDLAYFEPLIEHIGSTAIMGLSAKPIVDIMLGLPKDKQLNDLIGPMKAKGWVYYPLYNGVMPERRFFVKFDRLPSWQEVHAEQENPAVHGFQRLLHLHCVHIDTAFWERHLLFRDHPKTKTAYAALKKQLATQDWQKMGDYASAKSEFINKVVEQARNSKND